MRLFSCALAALTIFVQPVLAATCTTRADTAALKITVMRQQLITAALLCGEQGAYHGFAVTFQDELEDAETRLKAFLAQDNRGGLAAFRARAARLSDQEHARDAKAFCADARALFTAAQTRTSLAHMVEARSGAVNTGGLCRTVRPLQAAARPVPAAVKPPVRDPGVRSVKAMPPEPAPAKIERPVRMATATPPRRPYYVPPLETYDVEDPRPLRVTYYVPPLDTYDVEEDVRIRQADAAPDLADDDAYVPPRTRQARRDPRGDEPDWRPKWQDDPHETLAQRRWGQRDGYGYGWW